MLKNFIKLLKMHRKTIVIALLLLFIGLFGRLIVEGIKWSPVIFQYFFQREIILKETESRINVLFLGIGGGEHDGPLLTDTIIYASIDPKFQKTTLISIPRDLWIQDLKSKINTAYAIGEERRKGGGILLVKAAVEKSFEDLEYPISGKEIDDCGFKEDEFEKRATASAIAEAFPCRYEHLTFQQGAQHMDGEKALKFVRSRHAIGSEGTDFARAKRQDIVIKAFRDKALSLNIILNPSKLMGLYDVFQGSLDTNVKSEEYDDFIKFAQKMKDAETNNVGFFYSNPYPHKVGIFIHPPSNIAYDNQWVLIPRIGNGNFSEVQKYVECEIQIGNCPIP